MDRPRTCAAAQCGTRIAAPLETPMKTRIASAASALALAVAAIVSPVQAAPRGQVTPQGIASLVEPQAAEAVTVSVFATGLYNPRGLKFGPDGYLYVAEGGRGGTHSTAGKCEQVIPAVGPYTGSYSGSGRISRIDPQGVRTTVTKQLPSSQTSADLGSLISGVGDVAFIGNTLYAILAGAGCSHGVDGRDNAVLRIKAGGVPGLVANLSEYQKSHPVQNPPAGDFEPDGTWYSMIAVGNSLFAVEPNHGELVQVTTDGQIHRIADISASQGHIVPTAVAVHNGNFFVGNLNTFPIVKGSSKILRVTPSGQVTTVIGGLTTVLGLQFDSQDRMYVLQMSSGDDPNPTPGTGSILRIDHSGARETIVSGLSLPTAMTFGPDGDLYVSNLGFGAPPVGLGQVLRIHLGN